MKFNTGNKIVAIIDIICGILHICLEVFLWERKIKYVDFILIENAVVTFVFLFLGIEILRRKNNEVNSLDYFHTFFWVLFTVIVAVIKPQNTSLMIFGTLFNSYATLLLFAIGLISACLCTIYIYKTRFYKMKSL